MDTKSENHSPTSFRLRKKNKLKSKKIIQHLYSKGNSVKSFPIRAIYLPFNSKNFEGFSYIPDFTQVSVSAPKRNTKKAVDRNRLKRQMRESYRLNQYLLNKPHALFFIFMGKEKATYTEIESAMIKCLTEINKLS